MIRRLALVITVLGLSGCSLLTESRTCTTEFRFGLLVTVVDSVTGGPPTSAILIARSGSFIDSLGPVTPQSLVLNGPPVIMFPTAGERQGSYNLTVRAPGYRDWTLNGVPVIKNVCHVETTNVTARLQR